MGLRDFWTNYKVLIVMGTSLGLIHWGWYTLKANPLLQKNRQDYIPEPGIVAYVSPPATAPPPPPAAAKSK
uniref:Small integral membrane protein 26 n=2 Tax=Amphiprion TaxID=80969 RepID=A0AAQ5XHA0_AMPOC